MQWPQCVNVKGKLWLKVRPQKTQKKGIEYLEIPCHKILRAALEATPVEQRTGYIITTKSGAPYSPRTLAQAFRAVLYRLGIRGYSIHGLRKNAAVAMADAGCDTG
jgi:integrase